MRYYTERKNIGYPKLITGGAAGRRNSPAAPTVNNFAARRAGT
jgi:hypothetical protein